LIGASEFIPLYNENKNSVNDIQPVKTTDNTMKENENFLYNLNRKA
jgi:hypothetical protein